MEEKAPDAFHGVERHGALAIASLVILPPEVTLPSSQASSRRLVMARDACSGPGSGGPAAARQWRLGIDHPLRLLHGREELVPGWWRVQR